MKTKERSRVFALFCIATASMMTSCDPAAGATVYELIYPSGYAVSHDNFDKKIPVEGTSCRPPGMQDEVPLSSYGSSFIFSMNFSEALENT